jgi:hypothetical protein
MAADARVRQKEIERKVRFSATRVERDPLAVQANESITRLIAGCSRWVLLRKVRVHSQSPSEPPIEEFRTAWQSLRV